MENTIAIVVKVVYNIQVFNYFAGRGVVMHKFFKEVGAANFSKRERVCF